MLFYGIFVGGPSPSKPVSKWCSKFGLSRLVGQTNLIPFSSSIVFAPSLKNNRQTINKTIAIDLHKRFFDWLSSFDWIKWHTHLHSKFTTDFKKGRMKPLKRLLPYLLIAL